MTIQVPARLRVCYPTRESRQAPGYEDDVLRNKLEKSITDLSISSCHLLVFSVVKREGCDSSGAGEIS